MFILASLRFYFLISILLIAVVPYSVYGQSDEEKAFKAIPELSRSQLIERFGLYLEYECTSQYEKLYDLLSPRSITDNLKGKSQADYALGRREYDTKSGRRLIEFEPVATTKNLSSDLQYLICGRAKYKSKGETTGEHWCIDAYLENGEWYFSPGFFVRTIM
jgi:hypothetical protein